MNICNINWKNYFIVKKCGENFVNVLLFWYLGGDNLKEVQCIMQKFLKYLSLEIFTVVLIL